MSNQILNDPSAAANAATYAGQARPDKGDVDVWLAAFNGTGFVSGCAVTVTTGLGINVASGTVFVAGTTASVSSTNLTVATANSSDRIDLVVVNSSGTASLVTGTAATIPAWPNIPASSAVAAIVYVNANVVTLASTNLVDKRVVLPSPNSATTITSSGSYTVPAGCYLLDVTCISGGGGGGAGGQATGAVGGGGGAAGSVVRGFVSVTPGQAVSCTVGAGGTGGVHGTNSGNGGNGGATAFGGITTGLAAPGLGGPDASSTSERLGGPYGFTLFGTSQQNTFEMPGDGGTVGINSGLVTSFGPVGGGGGGSASGSANGGTGGTANTLTSHLYCANGNSSGAGVNGGAGGSGNANTGNGGGGGGGATAAGTGGGGGNGGSGVIYIKPVYP